MIINWEEAWLLVEDSVHFMDGNAVMWCEVMWKFIENHNLNSYNTITEKFCVYARLNGIVKLYDDFRNMYMDYDYFEDYFLDVDFQKDIEDLSIIDDEEKSICCDIFKSMISNDSLFGIISLLKQEINNSTLFSMLMYFLNDCAEDDMEDYDTEITALSSTDEYNNWFSDCQRTKDIVQRYCNNASIQNVRLFSWLNELLHSN